MQRTPESIQQSQAQNGSIQCRNRLEKAESSMTARQTFSAARRAISRRSLQLRTGDRAP
jgi:hypothetical protein